VVVIVVFVVLFAAAYTVVAQAQPTSFTEDMTHNDALYFTVTVFATVGFGDIAPVSTVARVVVTIQMIADLLLFGLVARALLSAVERGRARKREAGSPP
jgi:voltage-gated potassium channel